MPEMPPSRPAATRRIPIAIGAVVAVGVIGLGAFYGLGGFKRGPGGDPSCTAAVELARRIAPLAHGEVAALTMATAPAAAARPRLRGRRGQAPKALGMARQDRAGESLGHLVRALS